MLFCLFLIAAISQDIAWHLAGKIFHINHYVYFWGPVIIGWVCWLMAMRIKDKMEN